MIRVPGPEPCVSPTEILFVSVYGGKQGWKLVTQSRQIPPWFQCFSGCHRMCRQKSLPDSCWVPRLARSASIVSICCYQTEEKGCSEDASTTKEILHCANVGFMNMCDIVVGRVMWQKNKNQKLGKITETIKMFFFTLLIENEIQKGTFRICQLKKKRARAQGMLQVP